MENTEKKIKQSGFHLQQIAHLLGVSAGLLRSWETYLPDLQPVRSRNGSKLYAQQDVDKFSTLCFLVQEKGHSPQQASEIMQQRGQVIEDTVRYIRELQEIKKFLSDLGQGLGAKNKAD